MQESPPSQSYVATVSVGSIIAGYAERQALPSRRPPAGTSRATTNGFAFLLFFFHGFLGVVKLEGNLGKLRVRCFLLVLRLAKKFTYLLVGQFLGDGTSSAIGRNFIVFDLLSGGNDRKVQHYAWFLLAQYLTALLQQAPHPFAGFALGVFTESLEGFFES